MKLMLYGILLNRQFLTYSLHNLLFYLFIFQFSVPLSSQNKGERYTHPISLNEKRISDGKLEFKEKGVFPSEWKLFFKAKEGDFAVFYDWNGHEIHYRYRRNKFDSDGEEFVKHLFPGNPYLIKGEWTGFYFFPIDERGRRKSFSEKKLLPAKPEEFIDLQSIPIFKLLNFTEIYSDEMLY